MILRFCPFSHGCIRSATALRFLTKHHPHSSTILQTRSLRIHTPRDAEKSDDDDKNPPRHVEMQRHKPPTILSSKRPIVVACVPLKSNVNVSAIARAASCAGVKQLICCGTAKLLQKIAREAIDNVNQGSSSSTKKGKENEPNDHNNNNHVHAEKEASPSSGHKVEDWFKVHQTLYYPLKRLKEEGLMLFFNVDAFGQHLGGGELHLLINVMMLSIGYEIVGLEQTHNSSNLYNFAFKRKTVVVVGSENKGLPSDILSLCDAGYLFILSHISQIRPDQFF